MQLQNFQVVNYKSYNDPDPIRFQPGFNLITGKNNAGKTALLESLTLRFTGKPHRSLLTVPSLGVQPNPITQVHLTVEASPQELSDLLLVPGKEFLLVAPVENTDFTRSIPYHAYGDDLSALRLIRWLIQHRQLFNLGFSCPSGQPLQLIRRPVPTYGQYDPFVYGNVSKYIRFKTQPDKQLTVVGRVDAVDPGDVGDEVGNNLQRYIYYFRAERFNAGFCRFGSNAALAPDASNLAEVLDILQSDLGTFQEFNALLRSILPDVYAVSVRPVQGAPDVEIRVWTTPPDQRRPDLAMPLNECGTGIGQVLAMLYVVLTSAHPNILLIDEPQSFLHPGAARKLIEVFKGYPEHQYIIATHSPTIITACDPNTITVVRNQGGVSAIEQADVSKTREAQIYLSEIGARLSDVFGADNVVWVEGATEEMCFPKIAAKNGIPLRGTAICGVRSTGDFEGKRAHDVIDIYCRVSGTALYPPALCFIFDHELRTQQEKRELQNRALLVPGKSRVLFTRRRMYESYLLCPAAIASLLNQVDAESPKECTEELAQEALAELISDARYRQNLDPEKIAQDPVSWWVDAPVLLRDLFRKLTEARVSFDKTDHSVRLTEWVLEHDTDALKEIRDLMVEALQGARTGN